MRHCCLLGHKEVYNLCGQPCKDFLERFLVVWKEMKGNRRKHSLLPISGKIPGPV